MGRIYPLKGVKELLLGFINFLKQESKSATLILAGPDAGGLGGIKQILGRSGKLKSKVILTGEVAGDLKYSLLSQSDVVCLLSKSETIPTSLVEATSFGKPIICSKECNLQTLIENGGALLSPRDAQNISKNLRRLLSSDDFRRKTGNKALTWFEKNYNQARVLDEYNKVYANL